MMKYEWLDEYLLSLPGVEKDYKAEWQWFRYMIRGKLFAAVCTPEEKYEIYGGHDLVNLKCEPERAELLRAEYPEILPGFYCDKRLWIAALLDSGLPDDLLRELCANSHRLILEKLPKYVQKEILNP
jgi:predicted DNA-binding protein (MmcQ/YjbR family)